MKKIYLLFLLIAAMALTPMTAFAANGNLACTWTDSTRTQAKDSNGNIAVGLFKAARLGGGTSLYYSDANGYVVKRESLITVSTGERYVHIYNTEGEHWDVTGGGPLSYAITNHNGEYFVHWQQGIVTVNGLRYYVLSNGTVQTTAGLINVAGRYYYVNPGGAIRSQAGLFKASNGKMYLSDATGAIITNAGIMQYGGSYYAVQSDGSVATTVGFVKTNGKLCYVTNANGVLAVNKQFKVNGKKYHALNDATIAVGGHKWGKKFYYSDDSGAIRTKKGIVKAGGQYYFVQKGGKLAVNKKVKYRGKTYIASKSSALYRGIFKWKRNLYYANSKGVVRTKAGVITVDAEKYYVRKGGKIRRDALFTARGKKYCADEDGTLMYGHFRWGGSYYLTNDKCVIYTRKGIYSFNGRSYFVEKGGRLGDQEFEELNDKYYYANNKGEVVKSKFTYKRNGKKYSIHPNSKTGVITAEEYYSVYPEKAPKEDTTETENE